MDVPYADVLALVCSTWYTGTGGLWLQCATVWALELAVLGVTVAVSYLSVVIDQSSVKVQQVYTTSFFYIRSSRGFWKLFRDPSRE